MTSFPQARHILVLAGLACVASTAASAEPAHEAAGHSPAVSSPDGQSGRAASDVRPTAGTRAQNGRRTMLPLVQPLWSELSASQQQVLEPFASQWNTWPSAEKQSWVVLADRIPKMKPDEQARTQQRISEWAALTPEERRVARMNYRLARKLPPDERKAQWERYTQLTPEQREVLRTRGWTSNTAARHAGAPTGLAKDAAKPFAPRPVRIRNAQ